MEDLSVRKPTFAVEVITLPVSDVERCGGYAFLDLVFLQRSDAAAAQCHDKSSRDASLPQKKTT
jgi:hypothetical protein